MCSVWNDSLLFPAPSHLYNIVSLPHTPNPQEKKGLPSAAPLDTSPASLDFYYTVGSVKSGSRLDSSLYLPGHFTQ